MSGQRIAITGSSGMIGGALSAFLRERGDVVIRLVRRHPVGRQEAALPRPGSSTTQLAETFEDVDAVVNLAGAGIGDHRWSPTYKDTLRRSRLDTTASVVTALASVQRPVRLVSGSAIGIYGSRGDEVLDESSSPGDDFLARLCVDWEAAARSAGPHHHVALARTGLVFSRHGGAFAKLLAPASLGLGGPLGSGEQWWSWITLRDEVRALVHLLDRPDITGPVNLTAPRASRQREVAQSLGRSLMRPAVLKAPDVALSLALGEMSSQVMSSTRVKPSVLERSGFTWLDANQDQAIDRLVAGVSAHSTS